MRCVSLFLLILMLGSLLAAALVRAETAYYTLKFTGVQGEYVDAGAITLGNGSFTIGALIRLDGNTTDRHVIAEMRDGGYSSGGRGFNVHVTNAGQVTVGISDGTNYITDGTVVSDKLEYHRYYLIVVVFDRSAGQIRAYIDGQQTGTVDISSITGDIDSGEPLWIGASKNVLAVQRVLNGTIALFMLYNRTLSDSEIQQIYNNPLNPPQDGLILFYAPDSVDTQNNVWQDKSGNGNDGSIAGATAEWVSIPNVTAWDSIQGIPIPVYNLSISDTNGTTYIPWFMPLPYDTPVTLNVSAPGYYSSLYTVQAPMLSLNFTLVPIPTYVTVAKGAAVVYARGGNEGSFLDFLNLFKFWPGGDIGAKLMRLNIKGAVQSFFNDTTIPFLGIVVALLIWGGGVIMSWVYSGEPEFVALWGLALYLGLKDFIVLDEYLTMMNAVMVPFAFIIAMLYLKKVLDTFGGG